MAKTIDRIKDADYLPYIPTFMRPTDAMVKYDDRTKRIHSFYERLTFSDRLILKVLMFEMRQGRKRLRQSEIAHLSCTSLITVRRFMTGSAMGVFVKWDRRTYWEFGELLIKPLKDENMFIPQWWLDAEFTEAIDAAVMLEVCSYMRQFDRCFVDVETISDAIDRRDDAVEESLYRLCCEGWLKHVGESSHVPREHYTRGPKFRELRGISVAVKSNAEEEYAKYEAEQRKFAKRLAEINGDADEEFKPKNVKLIDEHSAMTPPDQDEPDEESYFSRRQTAGQFAKERE